MGLVYQKNIKRSRVIRTAKKALRKSFRGRYRKRTSYRRGRRY